MNSENTGRASKISSKGSVTDQVRDGLALTYGDENVDLFIDCAEILFDLFKHSPLNLSFAESLLAAEDAIPKWLDISSSKRFEEIRFKIEDSPCSIIPNTLTQLKRQLNESGKDEQMASLLMCSINKIRYKCPELSNNKAVCPIEKQNGERDGVLKCASSNDIFGNVISR